MYRLLATDIDDTLLAPDGSLPEANRMALRDLHEAGVAIVFCSGRSDVSIQRIASTILSPADDEYLISFNGARVVTAASRRVVARRYVSSTSVGRVAAYARANGLYLQGYVGDEFLVEEETETTLRYAQATDTTFHVVPDLAAALPEGSPKLLIIGDHDLIARHQSRILTLDPSLQLMFSKTHYLEIVADGVNKGSALRHLAAALEIPIEETIAVGDAANDAEMLAAAGVGIAVANARAEARAAADVTLELAAKEGAMAEIARTYFGRRKLS